MCSSPMRKPEIPPQKKPPKPLTEDQHPFCGKSLTEINLFVESVSRRHTGGACCGSRAQEREVPSDA